jgi:hypothetical protein
MSAENIAAFVAAGASAVAVLVALVMLIVLSRRIREIHHMIRDLRIETVPLVRDARVVVDQAATEMLRVGDVLSTTEAVTGTVDSASRLAYRAFANPVVKVLAFSTGGRSALRRLFFPRAGGSDTHTDRSDVGGMGVSLDGKAAPRVQPDSTNVLSVHRRRRGAHFRQ